MISNQVKLLEEKNVKLLVKAKMKTKILLKLYKQKWFFLRIRDENEDAFESETLLTRNQILTCLWRIQDEDSSFWKNDFKVEGFKKKMNLSRSRWIYHLLNEIIKLIIISLVWYNLLQLIFKS